MNHKLKSDNEEVENGDEQQPPMTEIAYFKWYNEVWPTLYNKDPNNHLMKGTIKIVKRDSIKSKGNSTRNQPMMLSINSNDKSVKSGQSGQSRNN